MSLFSPEEIESLKREIENKDGNILITFKNCYGPTRLEALWSSLLENLGLSGKGLHWWSSSGTLGLLEFETPEGRAVYGQWALSDKMKMIGVFEISDQDIVDIRDGFDAGNVVSSEMRAIRIGETGDRD
jgi:hypothetical protein